MRRTILLADDSLMIQKAAAAAFEDGDFEVSIVANGDEALAAVGADLPDMVIADLHMPGASGYDVARGVKGLSSKTPVLLLIGTFEPFDESEVEACSADGYLMKPFEEGELRHRVETMLGVQPPSAPPHSSRQELQSPETGRQDMQPPVAPPPNTQLPDTQLPDTQLPDTQLRDTQPLDRELEGQTEESQRQDAQPEAEERVPRSPAPTDRRDPTGPSEVVATETEAHNAASVGLSADDVERIARRVVELMSPAVVREVAAEVVPRLATEAVRERIAELERDLPD